MSRFDFTNITRSSQADILDVMGNFNEIENTAAIIDDLAHVYNITLSAGNWVAVSGHYEYTISNANIEVEPQIINVIFDDLTKLLAPIYAKPNSQAAGSIKLMTSIQPRIALSAKLILMKGVV